MGFPAMRMVDGRYSLPTGPGLGINISEAALKRYPFQGTRPFPAAFHEDGSVGFIVEQLTFLNRRRRRHMPRFGIVALLLVFVTVTSPSHK